MNALFDYQCTRRHYSRVLFTLAVFVLFSPKVSFAQCPTDLLTGQNLLTNGDFSGGYSNWTYTADTDGNPNTPAANSPNGYIIFNPPATQSYSQPGFIYAGATPSFFNSAFGTFNDHTTTNADNMMLMVDGVCSNGIKLWSQSGIPLSANTNYYFSVWVHSLKDGNSPPGTLQFDINGVNLATTITAPTNLASGWVQYETVWNSGATPPATGTISIENTTTVGCDQYVDFAIDDISFIPGCTFGAPGPQPNLGVDKTLCGTGGSIVLNAGVPVNATTTVTWSSNAPGVLTGTGVGAPYSKTITAPGTYSVCVTDNGSCVKSDVVVITNNYSIDLGADRVLCNPASVTLDAVFTGTGVTYQWYKETNGVAGWQFNAPSDTINNGKTRTMFVNSAGTYRVEVTDPSCGMRFDEVTITSTAPTPVDVYYCPTQNVTLTVTPVNSGKYKWWNHPTSTALANRLQVGGNTYTFSASSAAGYTYYAEDTSSFSMNVGPAAAGHGFTSPQGRGVQGETELIFNVTQGFTLNSIAIEALAWSCPENKSIAISIYDASNALVGTSTQNLAFCGAGGSASQVTMPINIALPVGNGYKMKLTSGSNVIWYNGGATYPMTYTALTITGNSTSGWANNAIPSFLNWNITAGSGCTRVPVRAIHNCSLPVEYIYFNAESVTGKVVLKWATAWEDNNAYFIIERSSDGINFEQIGYESGNGTSSSGFIYSSADHHPLNGTSYYRLGQLDHDGMLRYSPVAAVYNSSSGVTVSPNPSHGVFTIAFKATANEEVKLSLLNPMGQLMWEESSKATSENFSKNLNIQNLSAGIYYLQVESQSEKSITKIIKE